MLDINADVDKISRKIDKLFLILLYIHIPFAALFYNNQFAPNMYGLFASLLISGIGTLSYLFSSGTRIHNILNGILLLSYSIVLITLNAGRLEMHFHVFFSLATLTVYKDWRVIPPAAIYISLHHAIFNYCQENNLMLGNFPLLVFNYGNGWDIVLLHALFVVLESIVLMFCAELLYKSFVGSEKLSLELKKLVEEKVNSLSTEVQKNAAYRKALDQFAMVSITDPEGRIIDVNNVFEEISGFRLDELQGKTHQLINSGFHDIKYFKNFWRVIKDGKVWKGEMRNKSKNGKFFWVDSVVSPIIDNGDIKYFISIKKDITEKVESINLVQEQQEQITAQVKLSALGEMAGGIAHEINNPLAIISATTKSMKKELSKENCKLETLKSDINDIETVVARISKIIVGLKNVSRDGAFDQFSPCLIKDVFEDLRSILEPKFKNSDAKLDFEFDYNVQEIPIEINRVQISQVFLNLIVNAYDAILNLEEKWIKILVKDNGDSIRFFIKDSGKGIPLELQEKIFKSFFTTKPIGKGTGLGLSISMNIIKKHNGRFYLDNSNENTCFIIELPKKHFENINK